MGGQMRQESPIHYVSLWYVAILMEIKELSEAGLDVEIGEPPKEKPAKGK